MTGQQENELIAERLLNWKPCSRHVINGWMEWAVEPGPKFYRTPTFTTWHDAGLILDRLQWLASPEDMDAWKACESLSESMAECILSPTEIRAAALAYLRSLER